ncbi:hypothetical protein CAPTEDRAFT_197414, partial [Capitella teleta]
VIQASVDMKAAEMAAGQAAIELAHLKSGLNLLDLNDSVVMFCDFYRAQAWYRWMRSNGSAKSSLKFLLQQVDCVVCGRWFHATCLKSAAREMGLIRNNSEDWRCKICLLPNESPYLCFLLHNFALFSSKINEVNPTIQL